MGRILLKKSQMMYRDNLQILNFYYFYKEIFFLAIKQLIKLLYVTQIPFGAPVEPEVKKKH